MRWESLVLGILVLLFGIYLVASHGYLGSTYLPGLIGLPSPTSNSTTPNPLGTFGGFGPGTIVSLTGLGLISASLRTPSRSTTAAAAMPPELSAALLMAQQRMGATSMPNATMPTPATRACSRCGAANSSEAVFCQKCGTAFGSTPANPPAPGP